MPYDNELFNDEFMNDMLLNPKAYGMADGHEGEFDSEDEGNGGDDFDEYEKVCFTNMYIDYDDVIRLQ